MRPPDRCIALLIGRDGRPLIEVKQPPKLADKVSRLKKGRAEQLTSARPQGNTGTRAECSDGRRCCRDQGLDTEVRQLHRGRWCIGQGEPRRNLRPDWSEWSGQEHANQDVDDLVAADFWIAGFDISLRPAEVRRRIGYAPQLLSANGSLTDFESLLLSARLYGVPRHERRERIERALVRMGLAELAHHLAGQYSGGHAATTRDSAKPVASRCGSLPR